ncbi:MAG: FAD-dependent oxidoreductase [Bryobacterales bacterium]|nr:FAD-dependent oxidoreductase [Bryobacterales bacterium]
MKRRDLIRTVAGFTGYSVYVNAQDLSPAGALSANAEETAARTAEAQRIIRMIEPLSGDRHLASPEPNMRLLDLSCDVFVAGGGPAGVHAAISAARHGAKVILAQDRSRLGGNSSSEVKMHIVGANCHKGRPGWREGGLLEELRLDDAVNNPQRCWEMWDLLLYDKCVSEPNITLLLDAALYSAETKGGKIERVMVRCDKTEHLYRISAKVFLDCTGDSRLGLEAGAENRYGREARGEFGESLAPEKPDAETMGNSILFTSKLYDKVMPFTPPKWARKVTREHLKHRGTEFWEYGYWWIEWGGQLNTIHDNERIRFELLAIVMGVWDYIKNSGEHPNSRRWALDWVGMMPGKRESRRLVGDSTLKQQDLEDGGHFDDAVAIGGWPMDDHPPGGFDRADLSPAQQIRTKEVFNIPYSTLYSRNIQNLLMAGRNASATHVAFSSTRVMATCAVLGQAAGTAAAQCVREGVTPRQLRQDKSRLARLQQTLLRDDQTIMRVKNEDPLDLARTASVEACGHEEGREPAKVLNGTVRDIPKSGAAPLVMNHWAAKMGAEPAWIELVWQRPQSIGWVQITFDTGFQRELTLTANDSMTRTIVRAPQPETVRDYELQVKRPGATEYETVAKVEGNHQRLNRVSFEAKPVERLRVRISKTNGDPLARVFEIRAYTRNPLV